MNILGKIIRHKKKELALLKMQIPVKKLEQSPLFGRETIPLTNYIIDTDRTGIIAEFKRKSPSKGIINDIADPEKVVSGYCQNNASAVSVLTDSEFFGGSNIDLTRARTICSLPILRKDFIIDEYQITETMAAGADAILLIAAALDKKRITELARYAANLGLQVILEIHNRSEIEMINDYINIVGVNNRDLTTFKVEIGLSLDLADKIPECFVKISESGISSPLIIKQLKKSGYQGFLIGEKFMNSPDPVAAFSDFIKMMNRNYAED